MVVVMKVLLVNKLVVVEDDLLVKKDVKKVIGEVLVKEVLVKEVLV